jgi:type IV / VI secretion system protein, DotU family
MVQQDDKTVFLNLNGQGSDNDLPSSIRPVTAASQEAWPQRSMQYLAQQTSLVEYTSGLNPLVNAAVPLLLTIVRLRDDGDMPEGSVLVTQGGPRPGVRSEAAGVDIEELRTRLEADIRGFENLALASDIENAQVLAARYLLCTAVDEAISTSSIGASGAWSKLALLSTFHNETWGGEKFFQILDRCMQQPARNLFLLELMYLLLSLGFEGKFRVADRGAIAIETHRDKIYRQVKLLRGEPGEDLSKKVEPGEKINRIYAYIPSWLLGIIVVICVAVTLFGFSTVLEHRAEPILEQLENAASIRQGGE